ncbi:MAG: transporter substrate-binding domain-containing protein [Acidobacteriota bacterium]|nr:transporter substrate-binding domain-containing protein [Acidobacteriota bacterium]
MVETSKSKTATILVAAAVIAMITSFATFWLLSRVRDTATVTAASAITDLDRIVERRVIRAGYVSNPPSCIIDPNTKKVTGVVAESVERIAESAGLKVEWTEEVGFGSMVEGLRAGRYDIVPCAIWPTAARAREADFTDPLFYSAVAAYVRPDDKRFGDKLAALNSRNVRIATIDGELAETIAQTQFPDAQTVGLPQMTEISTMLLNVKENKADVAFVELYFAEQFLKNNPGSLVRLAPDQPVRIFPNTILLRKGQAELKAFLNTGIDEQFNLGAIDRTIAKFEPVPGTFHRLSQPYAPAVRQ